MLYVAFRRAAPWSGLSGLIRLFAGRPVHCALVDEKGVGWESQAPNGVRRLTITDPTAWDLMPVPYSKITAFTFCKAREGTKYDYVGAVFGPMLAWIGITSSTRWTCSELCGDALVSSGAPVRLLEYDRRPKAFRQGLVELL